MYKSLAGLLCEHVSVMSEHLSVCAKVDLGVPVCLLECISALSVSVYAYSSMYVCEICIS